MVCAKYENRKTEKAPCMELFQNLFLNPLTYAAKALTNLANLDLWFAALFLWIIFFLTNLSSIEDAFLNTSTASTLVVVAFNLLTTVLVDLS
jgi:hypothetical protein